MAHILELKDETLHIRIAGVDAPEAAHFGNPAQPHSQESLDWLRQTILGKSMRCQLLRKDQYNRIVRSPRNGLQGGARVLIGRSLCRTSEDGIGGTGHYHC
jgi:endonuclease YncB( thermonuclease family)